ncbi:MAG: VOC family protein [Alphaproteobacteria bacterium]|nr:VOC family protein [Alphaproteobacteria bacterium]
MQYLHTMVRIRDIEESLDFYCNKLGMVEVFRREDEKGRYTLIFLAANDDEPSMRDGKRASDLTPSLELTYNWPDENGDTEEYEGGRNFGHLAYRVDNIYDVCQKLMDNGVVINRPPRDGYMAFVKSPDGISFELLQRGERLEPQEPWVSMENNGSW